MTATQEAESPQRLLTIGAVCRQLQPEFPDISISKIRYLEDQRLLEPKRTQGGYRLFAEEDLERLRTILRLQRDEFLPLRVIRQELAQRTKGPRRKRPVGLADGEDQFPLSELCERAGIAAETAHELEAYGLLEPRRPNGEKLYGDSDVEIATTCARLAPFGIALLQQILAPALRSRNPERRKAGLEDLQTLAELAQELSQLLFWRDLRRVAGT